MIERLKPKECYQVDIHQMDEHGNLLELGYEKRSFYVEKSKVTMEEITKAINKLVEKKK